MLFSIFGSLLMAIGVNIAFIPLKLFSVGFPGFGVLLHYTTGVGVGLVVFLLNIPLFLLAWRYIGKAFVLKNITVAFTLSVLLDLLYPLSEIVQLPLWLGVIVGGLLMGVGTALIFRQGLTSGGVGLLARLLQLRFPHWKMGPIHIVFDSVVLLMGAIVMDLRTAFYTFIAAFIMSRTIDIMKSDSPQKTMYDKQESIRVRP